MAKNKKKKFEKGETVRLLTGLDPETGENTSRYAHDKPVGTLVILDRWDSSDNTWLVHVVDRDPLDMYDFWVKWNEIETDLEPVTDDEIRQLFGTTKEAT